MRTLQRPRGTVLAENFPLLTDARDPAADVNLLKNSEIFFFLCGSFQNENCCRDAWNAYGKNC